MTQKELDKEILAAIKKQWPDTKPFAQHAALINDYTYGWVRPVVVEIDGVKVDKHEGVYTRWDFEIPLTPENVIAALATNEKLYGLMLFDKPME